MTDNALYQDIKTFIKQNINNTKGFNLNQWFSNEQIQIYIRCIPKRLINGQFISTIDIANVSVEEEYQGQKIFTNLLNFIETEFNNTPIFVESILNNRLEEFLIKRNYIPAYTGQTKVGLILMRNNT